MGDPGEPRRRPGTGGDHAEGLYSIGGRGEVSFDPFKDTITLYGYTVIGAGNPAPHLRKGIEELPVPLDRSRRERGDTGSPPADRGNGKKVRCRGIIALHLVIPSAIALPRMYQETVLPLLHHRHSERFHDIDSHIEIWTGYRPRQELEYKRGCCIRG